jgi:ABC-2 type transport system permease protein
MLSKPVSRTAFLLSKLLADAWGVLGTMVVVQGVAAYFIYKAATGTWLSVTGFLAGLGLVYLFLIFFLALTLMLSTVFHSRGPVIAIPLALISFSGLTVSVPWLGEFLPAGLTFRLGPGQLSLAEALALGQPLPTATPIIGTGLLILLFIIIALRRFEREEF